MEVDNITHKTTPKRTGCVAIDINWNARSQLLHDDSLTIKYKTCFWDLPVQWLCPTKVQHVYLDSLSNNEMDHTCNKKLKTNNIYTWSENTAEIIQNLSENCVKICMNSLTQHEKRHLVLQENMLAAETFTNQYLCSQYWPLATSQRSFVFLHSWNYLASLIY